MKLDGSFNARGCAGYALLVALALAVGAFAAFAKRPKRGGPPTELVFARAHGTVSFHDVVYRLRALSLSESGVACVVGEHATIACEGPAFEDTWTAIEPKDAADADNDAVKPHLNGVAFAGGWYAVGDEGAIVRFDLPPTGGKWERDASPTSTTLRAVMPYDGGALAVGDGGVTLRKQADAAWVVEAPAGVDLLAVLPDPPLSVGKGGAIFAAERSGGTLRWVRQPSPTTEDLLEIARLGDDVWIRGATGTLLRASATSPRSWSVARAALGPRLTAMCPLGERGLLVTFDGQEEAAFITGADLNEAPIPHFTHVKTMACTESVVRRITSFTGETVQTERVVWP